MRCFPPTESHPGATAQRTPTRAASWLSGIAAAAVFGIGCGAADDIISEPTRTENAQTDESPEESSPTTASSAIALPVTPPLTVLATIPAMLPATTPPATVPLTVPPTLPALTEPPTVAPTSSPLLELDGSAAVEFIDEYFSQATAGYLDESWAMCSPAYQVKYKSFDVFSNFWTSVTSSSVVELLSSSSLGPDGVEVDLFVQFDGRNGLRYDERVLVDVIRDGQGGLVINDYLVLSSDNHPI